MVQGIAEWVTKFTSRATGHGKHRRFCEIFSIKQWPRCGHENLCVSCRISMCSQNHLYIECGMSLGSKSASLLLHTKLLSSFVAVGHAVGQTRKITVRHGKTRSNTEKHGQIRKNTVTHGKNTDRHGKTLSGTEKHGQT